MIVVHSSQGDIEITTGGEIIDNGLEREECGDAPMPLRFDVAEYMRRYGRFDGDIDILDIGYWHLRGYEPPEPGFRLGTMRGARWHLEAVVRGEPRGLCDILWPG
jgi:hypothetical protein